MNSDTVIPGFVDHHAHLLEVVAIDDAPLREFREGPRAYHHRLAVTGSSPMDDVPERDLPPDIDERLALALEHAAQVGLVEITEAGLIDWNLWNSLVRLREADRLPLRVRVILASGIADQVRMQRTDDPALDVIGVKFYADGWLGARTCAVREPFADEPDNRGELFLDHEALTRRAAPYADAGWQIATHAIGDRAIVEVLDAYEGIYGRDCPKAAPRIEHCQIVDEEIIARMAELGVVACIQPSFAKADAAQALQGLGQRRAAMAYRWDLFRKAGVPILAGNDYPVETLSPLQGLYDATVAENARLTRSQAFELLTDERSGHTVLSADPLSVTDEEITGIEVRSTRPSRQ